MLRSVVKGAFELARRAASASVLDVSFEVKGDSSPLKVEVAQFSVRLKRVEPDRKIDKP